MIRIESNNSHKASHKATKSKRIRRTRTRTISTPSTTTTAKSISLFLFCLFVSNTCLDYVQGQFQETQEPQCKPQEPTKYDWERFNYYQLLGLTDDKNAKTHKNKNKSKNKKGQSTNTNSQGISAKEIRKAYRKQAQKYHPDKQASKNKSNDKQNSNSSKPLSMEESNARFAKIAEAYEFLLDESKRKDYDLFLEYCHNTEIVQDDEGHEGRLSTIIKKRFHGLFDDLVSNRDPFKVFKDVFFGADDDENYFDPNDPFSHLRYENNPQRHPSHQEHHPNEEPYSPQEDPLRVFHDKRFMYDPTTGENVIRVLQTEEYPPSGREAVDTVNSRRGSTRGGTNSTHSSSSKSSFYYRIIAQDFRERYDPFTAKQVYVPITEPYLQEDGFRSVSASKDYQPTKSSHSASVESILHPWEVLTPRSKPMVSPNKRYIAGLSPDCELLVMLNPDRHNSNDDNDDWFGTRNNHYEPPEILWGSKRPYGTNGYAVDHCFALLKGPHLVVTVGQHPQQAGGYHNNNRILWHSDSRNDDDDSRHGYYEYEDEYGFWHKRQRSYLAQLDNDGSLTVYSVWSVPQDQQNSRKVDLSQHSELASSVARAARDFWRGRIPTNHEYDHLYSTSRSLTYKRCVYSTHGSNLPRGIGCYRISRRLHQAVLEATLAIRKLVWSVNHFADAWLDLIYEEDDLFFFFKESIRKNTHFGSKLAGSSARFVRKVLEGLKHLNPNQQQS